MNSSRTAQGSRAQGARPARRPRRTVLLVGAAVVVLAGAGVGIGFAVAPHPVGTIGGVAVGADEVAFQEQRAAHQGESGDAAVRARALDAIADDHALIALAREAGVTTMTSPAQILDARQGANETKEALAASGQVVYGKTSYSATEFYSRTLADLRSALVKALTGGSAPALTVSDADVQKYLAAHADDWSAKATTFTVTTVTLPAAADGGAPAALTGAGPRPSLEQLAAGTPGATLVHTVYDPAALDAAGLSPDTTQQLQSARAGDTIDPFAQRGGWVLLRVDARAVDAAAALAEHGDEIRAKLLDAKVDDLIAEKRRSQADDLH